MKKEYIGQVSGIEEIIEQVREYRKEGYRVMYVGKTKEIERRLREYESAIGGEGSTAPALLRSIVRSINELFPFDNILRTYINTGLFLYAQSDRASELEKELIENLNPKPELNTRKGSRGEAEYVYLFMHKESPVEFIERNFSRLKDLRDYILQVCFELNFKALPYEEEQETGKMIECMTGVSSYQKKPTSTKVAGKG